MSIISKLKRIAAAALAAAMLLGITSCSKDDNADSAVEYDLDTLEGLSEYMKGKTLAFKTGTIFDSLAPEWFPESEILQFNSESDLINSLVDGKSDAILNDKPVAMEVENTVPGLRTSDVILMPDCYGAMFSLENTELRDKFNATMSKLKEDTSFDNMTSKWLNATDRTMPDIQLTGENGTLKIATTAAACPFSYTENGKTIGFNFELLERFCQEYGYNYEVQIMDFSAIIPAVVSGKCDMGIDSISITDERKKQVSFSDPYYEAGAVAMLRADVFSSEKGKTTAAEYDVEGMKIGAGVGAFAMTAAENYFKNATLEYYNSESDGFLAVREGVIDAYASGGELLDYAKSKLEGVRIIRDAIGSCDIAVGISKENTELKNSINKALEQFKADGTLDDMYDRWIIKAQTTIPEITPAENPNGTLRVGTCPVVEPFSFMKDGDYCGYDIELAYRLAAYLGMDISFETYDFLSIVPALTSDKIDVAISDLNVTAERLKMIDYSITYYQSPTYLLVKDENSDSAKAITTIEQLQELMKGRKVTCMAGSIQETLAKKCLPDCELVYLSTDSDVCNALEAGKADARFSTGVEYQAYMQGNPDSKQIILDNIELAKFDIGFIFDLDNTKLCDEMNEFLADANADGSLQEKFDYWYSDISNYKKVSQDYNLTGENGTLNVATSSTNQPGEFMFEGEITGHEIELIYMFCEKYGYNVNFVDTEFAAIIPSLQSGKVDMGAHTFVETAERAEQVLFSDPTFSLVMSPVISGDLVGGKTTDDNGGLATFFASLGASFERTFITENRWQLIVQGILTTLIISIFSGVFGTMLGFGICMARRSKRKWLNIPALVVIKVIQGTPIVVILMILYYIIFGNINAVVVAIVGFSINFGVYVSEMMRTGIDAVDRGQTEAAAAIGFTKVQSFVKIVLPQAAKHFLPVFKGEFISMVKMTSVVGYIAIQDLTKMSDIIRSRTYEAFFPLIATAIIYFIISWLLTLIISRLEIKIDPKHRKRIIKGVKEHD